MNERKKLNKLTEAQRHFMGRAAVNGGEVRGHGGREHFTAERLIKRGLLGNSAPGYGSDYYLTDAGRALLAAEAAVKEARSALSEGQ